MSDEENTKKLDSLKLEKKNSDESESDNEKGVDKEKRGRKKRESGVLALF